MKTNPLMRMTLALAAVLLAATPAAANSSPAQVEKAAASGNLKRLERLLGDGFDPGTLRHGLSPLHWAAFKGQVEAARLLIAHGIEVDVNSSGGLTPLMSAVERSQIRMARFLVEAGAEVNAETAKDGKTPLHLAAKESAPEVVAFLLSVGADPMRVTEKGFSALHMWARNGDPDTLTHLLDAGSDPLARISFPGEWYDQALPLDGVRKYHPRVLNTEPGRRLLRLTYEGTGCEGVIVLASDSPLSVLAERTLGEASRWKQIAELNGLGPDKSYRLGDCLKLPVR